MRTKKRKQHNCEMEYEEDFYDYEEDFYEEAV